ncbi:hypothetical protein ACOSQ3_017835 [Xanthoceras sorbifolium]
MKVLKGYVKNRTRPEGCIAERYLSEEYTLFCSKYFKQASEIIDEIKCNASCVSNTLKWFAHGPRDLVMSFNGYIINGLRFHTKEAEKSRQNSGVLVEATTLCRSSARDDTQILGQVAYYGDPFILASQAKQVFYCRENETSNWYVVGKAPPRGYHELQTYDENYMPSIPRNLGGLETIIDNGNEDLNLRIDVEGILCDT